MTGPTPRAVPLAHPELRPGPEVTDLARWQRAYRTELRGPSGIETLSRSGTRFTSPHPDRYRAVVATAPLERIRIISLRATAHRASWDPQLDPPEQADDLIVAILREGSLVGHHDGRTFAQRPGSVSVTRLPQPMNYVASKPVHMVSAQLPIAMLRGDAQRALPRVTTFQFGPTALTGALSALLLSISAESPSPGTEPARALESTILGLVSGLILEGAVTASGEGARRDYTDAVLSLEADLASPDLTLAGLAASIGSTPQRLESALRAHGTSLRKLVSELRLERVTRILRSDRDVTLTDAAAEVGFRGFPQAARAFRARYGMSMGDFRLLSRM